MRTLWIMGQIFPQTKLVTRKSYGLSGSMGYGSYGLGGSRLYSHRVSAIGPKMESVADFVEFSPERLGTKVIQVCSSGLIDGLAYLHRLCIADRDIKPHNLLVDRDFCLKIIDFDYCYASKGRGRGGR